MCGIAGFIDASFSNEDLKRMTDAIAHRGPDAGGYYFDDKSHIGLGHRRLSIIDLSTSANQPFYSASGRYVMVFNGEIYNYQDLKIIYNLYTKTSSDTEIIIELFEQKGVEIFNELNGMFAIAIWDTVEKKLYLVRDRVGKKPLYIAQKENKIHFASELKSLISLQPRNKSLEQVSTFLHLGYMPESMTFYEGVKKLPTASYLVFEKGKVEIIKYWDVRNSIGKNKDITEKEAIQKTFELLGSAVSYRMVADVPVGTFLSGGIDSSLVTAVASYCKVTPIETFSIGFKEAKFNEADYAKAVAKHLGTHHHEFMLTIKEAQDRITSIIDIYDEPYIDSSAIPTLLVSEMTRKHVTVALSGDGGDELFLGYGMYDWANRLDAFPYYAGHKVMGKAFKTFGNNRYKRIGEVLDYNYFDFKPSHIFSQEQGLFSQNEINEMMVKSENTSIDCLKKYSFPVDLSTAEKQALFDFEYYLPEDLMVKVDRASMVHALETRAPLLDYRLMEFAYSLPENLRKKDGVAKYLLKETLYKYVPKSFFDRPKWGFSIPLGEWLLGDLSYLIDQYLSKEIIDRYAIVKYSFVQKLISRFRNGDQYLYNRLWALIILHQWMEEK
jgi:asparagine synthase (glutamine-hydrolysing)